MTTAARHLHAPPAAASPTRTRSREAGAGAMRTVGRVLVEARPIVLTVGAARFVAGGFLSGGVVLGTSVGLGVLAWVLVTLSVYVLNGVSDLETDRVNGSRRPLASGRLALPTARAAVLVAGVLGLVLGALASPVLLVHLAIALVLGIAYSVGPAAAKNRSGAAFAVVVGGGLVTYHAGLVAAGGQLTPPFVAFTVSLSLWMGVGSLLKDLTDVTGDRAAGRRTLAVRRGPAAAAVTATMAAAVIAIGLVLASRHSHDLAPHLLGPALVLLAGTVALLGVCATLTRRHEAPYRLFMQAQVSSHVVLYLI